MKQKLIFIFLACFFFSLSCLAQDTFTYPKSNKFEIGKTITPVTPANSNAFSGYSIKPGLPSELKLDTLTGTISGLPDGIAGDANYVITAKNKIDGKTSTANLSISTFVNQPNSGFCNCAIICIVILCFVIIAFLIFSALRATRNATEALGLPSGSVRAILAILFVVFFALLSVIFYFNSGSDAKFNPDLAKQIVTILGTLVTAVSSFYFGAKTSEQAQKNVQQQANANLAATNQAATNQAAANQAAANQAATNQVAANQATANQGAANQGATDQGATDQVATNQGGADQGGSGHGDQGAQGDQGNQGV